MAELSELLVDEEGLRQELLTKVRGIAVDGWKEESGSYETASTKAEAFTGAFHKVTYRGLIAELSQYEVRLMEEGEEGPGQKNIVLTFFDLNKSVQALKFDGVDVAELYQNKQVEFADYRKKQEQQQQQEREVSMKEKAAQRRISDLKGILNNL
ncbi:hypothetical protein GOV03_04255 [Candidatus Woesearchaeota archaeon]|nr:hypothetical protein [Candidatus Woesearchaeota archaeon]